MLRDQDPLCQYWVNCSNETWVGKNETKIQPGIQFRKSLCPQHALLNSWWSVTRTTIYQPTRDQMYNWISLKWLAEKCVHTVCFTWLHYTPQLGMKIDLLWLTIATTNGGCNNVTCLSAISIHHSCLKLLQVLKNTWCVRFTTLHKRDLRAFASTNHSIWYSWQQMQNHGLVSGTKRTHASRHKKMEQTEPDSQVQTYTNTATSGSNQQHLSVTLAMDAKPGISPNVGRQLKPWLVGRKMKYIPCHQYGQSSYHPWSSCLAFL